MSNLEIHEPALILVLRYEAEPLVIAPAETGERDRIIDWLVHAYPDLAAAVEAAARASISHSDSA